MKSGLRVALALGLGFAVQLPAATYYVNLNNPAPTPPYTNWFIAATNIQDAVDASSSGDLILVTNGVYKTGFRGAVDSTPCRVVVDKQVTLRSVNGPDSTIIEGFSLPGSFPWSLSSVRCAYLTNGASLIGFTLTNGSVRATAYVNLGDPGGGVLCASTSEVLSNCVIINCAAYIGGGAQGGTLVNCLITNCLGHIGGGGAYAANLERCEVIWTTAHNYGGLYLCNATNCNISYNLGLFGGGAFGGTISHCTVYGNYAATGGLGGGYGGGVNNVDCQNSIIFNNKAYTGGDDVASGTYTNCCVPVPVGGSGNITNAPMFVDTYDIPGNFHLQPGSPCINAGNNAFATKPIDLDGRPRIVGAKTDMGEYEFQGGNTNSYLMWLWNYYLLTDISFDRMDSDGDSLNNWQEWRAGTAPDNASSVLRMLPGGRDPSGITLSWQSVTNVVYYIQRSTNMTAAFSSIKSNIVGQAGITTNLDTTASGLRPFYYRVGVQ